MAHLENWSVCDGSADPYLAPELRPRVLRGFVTGHPKLEDQEIQSSRLEEIDYENRTARTKNTEYTLGEPDPEWLKWCDENRISRSHVKSAEIE